MVIVLLTIIVFFRCNGLREGYALLVNVLILKELYNGFGMLSRKLVDISLN